MASSLIDNDALKYGDRQRSKAELQHWWSYDLRFEKKSLSNIYFWIVFLFLMCALLCLYFLFFFHCLLCYLLREHFLICCSRVLISLCCILRFEKKSLSSISFWIIFELISDVCVVVFLFSFTVLCVICCARVFLFFVRACLYHCVVYLADVGRILYINGYYYIFLAYTNVCSVTELT